LCPSNVPSDDLPAATPATQDTTAIFAPQPKVKKVFWFFFSKKNKCLLFYKKEAKNFCPFSPRRLPCPDAARANLR
jgi:hypothetical protein